MSSSKQPPFPKIVLRQAKETIVEKALEYNLSPIVSTVLGCRLKDEDDILKIIAPKLKDLPHPHQLRQMKEAASRIADAVMNKEVIGLETDHDCDGQTSYAVLFDTLTKKFGHDKELIRGYIGHRLNEGYGLSAALLKRILEDEIRPSLVITADNGSSDEPRIAILKEEGIDVIVTDHHELPEDGPPKSAYACLNPTRTDCSYPDKLIAGCMVAWLTMAAVRIELIERAYLDANTPTLLDALDYVAVGTVADCVSLLHSDINRAIVTAGLKLINQRKRAAWQVLLRENKKPFTSLDLGFKIGPLLNSDGRLSDAFQSVDFLTSDNKKDAYQLYLNLKNQNEKRKAIQKKLTDECLIQALDEQNQGLHVICLFAENGHSGVHGITASRLKDTFGKPTVIFSPKDANEQLISGSFRGTDNVHIREALSAVHRSNENIFQSFGGHKGAAGAVIMKKDFKTFKKLFNQAIAHQVDLQSLYPYVVVDVALSSEDLTLQTIEELKILEPFGREFEMPYFMIEGKLKTIQALKGGLHLRLEILVDSVPYDAIWFNSGSYLPALNTFLGQEVALVFTLQLNEFNGQRKISLFVSTIEKAKTPSELKPTEVLSRNAPYLVS